MSKVGLDSTAYSAKFDAGCRKLDGFGVWRVALVIKLDARSGVEGAWVQVIQKVLKMSPNGRPGLNLAAPFRAKAPKSLFGRDFWAQVAPTWVPRPSKVAIPLQRGIEIAQTHFSLTNREKCHLGTPK